MRTIVYLSQSDLEKLLSGRKIEVLVTPQITRSDVMEIRFDMSQREKEEE